jgi:putative nucleotidyltransferase with HDIG domain
MVDIEKTLSKIADLPASKATFAAIVDLYNNPQASLEELERVIKSDFALTTKLLKVVNSSYYGLRLRVVNVEMAIRLLGLGTVKSIALATSIFDFLGFEHLVEKNGLWIHSWMVGYLAKALCKKFGYNDQEAVFVGGLLHDIGKLIFSKYFEIEYKLVLARVIAEQKNEVEVEEEMLGINHALCGSKILKKWNIPDNVIFFVENHHNSKANEINDVGLKLIILSNILANKFGYSFLKEKTNEEDIDIEMSSALTMEEIEQLLIESRKNVPEFF